MTEDPTKDLTTDEILRALLADVRALIADMQDVKARLGAVETRLGALEGLVEDRLKDTRPIWQAINARTERIEGTLSDIKVEMATMAYDSVQIRSAQTRLSSRVIDLENRMTGD